MKKLLVLILSAVIGLSATAQTEKNTDEPNQSAKMEKQENTITAQALGDAFVKDKAQAEKEYGKKVMRITGFAVFVGPDVYGLPSVELSDKKDGKSRILCVLPFTDYLKLRNVSKGNEVVMEGEVRSLYDKDQTVVVKECKIIDVKKK